MHRETRPPRSSAVFYIEKGALLNKYYSQSYVTWFGHTFCSHVYQDSFENVERFKSYEIRLTFCDDVYDDDDAIKGITIAQLFVIEKKTS